MLEQTRPDETNNTTIVTNGLNMEPTCLNNPLKIDVENGRPKIYKNIFLVIQKAERGTQTIARVADLGGGRDPGEGLPGSRKRD